MNQTIDKHRNKEFSSLSNDSDSRERFFVPKINDKSRRITSKKLLNSSGTRSVQDMLYEYAKQKKKVREFKQNFQLNETKQIAEAKIRENMLPKSRRILYQAFNDRFYNMLNEIGKIINYITHIQYRV